MLDLQSFFISSTELVERFKWFTDMELAIELYCLELCYKQLDEHDYCPEFIQWFDWYSQYLLQEISNRYSKSVLGKELVNYPVVV